MTHPYADARTLAGKPSRALRNTLVFAIGIFIAAVATRIAHLGNEPFYDEIYHLLAAASWSENGTLAIYQGEYTRSQLYTILTGWMFELAGGPGIVAARAPNVLFGALLAAGSAVWVRQTAGTLAGWIVALCVLLWPVGIYLSQIVRFYALHGVLFFAGAVAAYDMFQPDRRLLRRLVMAALAAMSLWLANKFQATTMVGALGISLWAGLFVIVPAVLRLPRGWMLLVAAAIAMLATLAMLVTTDMFQNLWAEYRDTPWDMDPTAYHRILRETYPLLWPLTPVLAIFALRGFPGPASFCAVLVVFGIVAHSFAGVQNARHIYYLLPFLFALWGMGLQIVLPPVIAHVRRAAETISGPLARHGMSAALVACAMLFAILSNEAAVQSIRLIKGSIVSPFHNNANWTPARASVSRQAGNGAVIVVTNDLAAIYHMDGFDVAFSQNWLPEMQQMEFARDPRTGRPMIGQLQSLRDLVQAYPTGVFAASQSWWRNWPQNHDIKALIGAFNAPNVEWSIEDAGRISLLHWQTTGPGESPRHAEIREIVGKE